jgi:hypothetical protein
MKGLVFGTGHVVFFNVVAIHRWNGREVKLEETNTA